MKKNLLLVTSFVIATVTSPEVRSSEKSSRELARKLYISLARVNPSKAELDALEQKVSRGDLEEAARDIIDQRNGIKNGGAFYGVTVKDMVTPWSNEDRTTLAPLNDMSATIIGWVRDEKPFKNILSADTFYMAKGVSLKSAAKIFFDNAYPSGSGIVNPQALCGGNVPVVSGQPKVRVLYRENPNDANYTACKRSLRYTSANFDVTNPNSLAGKDSFWIPSLDRVLATHLVSTTNDHFESIDDLNLDLGNPELLQDTGQAKLHGNKYDAISGILSSRAWGSAFLVDGTNRAAIAFAMENFLCKTLEELNDTTIPDLRVRRDIDRSPGGESTTYKNRCVGCHAGMDALAGAYAYYDFKDGKLNYTPGSVVPKMNHNVLFLEGYVTQSNQWINLWKSGQNSVLGWGSTTGGEGLKSLGSMLAETQGFHSCMAKKVYEKVCMKEATSDQDKARIAALTDSYKNDNFNMKKLFINASLKCLED